MQLPQAKLDSWVRRYGTSSNSYVLLEDAPNGLIMARMPDRRQFPVNRIVAISLPMYGELAWKPSDAVIYLTHGTPHEKVFDARQYLKKLKQTPIVFVNAISDDNAPFSEAKSLYEATPGAKRLYAVKARGHHFEGGEKEFYQYLDLGLTANS
jgi:hypothetical protein